MASELSRPNGVQPRWTHRATECDEQKHGRTNVLTDCRDDIVLYRPTDVAFPDWSLRIALVFRPSRLVVQVLHLEQAVVVMAVMDVRAGAAGGVRVLLDILGSVVAGELVGAERRRQG